MTENVFFKRILRKEYLSQLDPYTKEVILKLYHEKVLKFCNSFLFNNINIIKQGFPYTRSFKMKIFAFSTVSLLMTVLSLVDTITIYNLDNIPNPVKLVFYINFFITFFFAFLFWLF